MTILDPADPSGWGPRHAHDPTAVRDDDGVYYLFSTDAYAGGPPRAGVQVRRSTDLATWEFAGYALEGVPADGAAWSGASGLWAPDVVRVPVAAPDDGAGSGSGSGGDGGGDGVRATAATTTTEWRMYWSASTFGSRTSAIGLAVAAHPLGPWEDRGLVVTSRHETPGPNAIDANAVVDDDGNHWLVYGSFFGGIHVLALDARTGLAARPGDVGTCVSRRPTSVEGAVEGAFVVPRPGGGHALLVSYDSLFSTYHVRAAVGEHVTGPFHDLLGHELTDTETDPALVGTTVLASHRFAGGRTWLAPGHGAVLTDGADQLYVHHVRDGDDPTQHEVQVRRLVWTHGRWPVVSPQPWAGIREERVPGGGPVVPDRLDALVGRWDVVTFDGATTGVTASREVTVTAADLAHVREHGEGRFTWTRGPDSFDGVAFSSWDAVRERTAWSVTGLDGRGRASLGTRLPD
ncbi:arabinan endo-1,5-alpha-L-arabinosidase [Cellulomonas cellasea]|uniref:Glycoside hydrolase family 43 n=2 Tax=Cellulomonas cellasea TaxID=43670 RepID=A0A0A0B238_9CELL|nr:arabinan endo-1,5-alpha-L-arabinosidase [Cellulomonas cellasea]KGM00865.1 glycoside hydrolase family 43 [Cellulomonas cellasea DSM 20118]GEA86413.1 beta-xylosidase [Cellulomonas cellasea]